MTRILVTGFEPFAAWPVNSSWEGARLLGERRREVRALRLPVDHRGAAEALGAALRAEAPEALLLTGLAPGALARLEILGRAGPLIPWAAAPRRGRWGWRAALGAMRGRGLAVRLSRDAGGYVCDTTYWAALGHAVPRVAFLHVPPLRGAWTAERVALAMEAALAGAAEEPPASRRSPALAVSGPGGG